jgi:hypothetical protein
VNYDEGVSGSNKIFFASFGTFERYVTNLRGKSTSLRPSRNRGLNLLVPNKSTGNWLHSREG